MFYEYMTTKFLLAIKKNLKVLTNINFSKTFIINKNLITRSRKKTLNYILIDL